MAPLARGSVVLCFALYKTEAQDGGPHTELKNKLCVTNSTARLVNGVPWAAEGVRHCTTTQGTRGGCLEPWPEKGRFRAARAGEDSWEEDSGLAETRTQISGSWLRGAPIRLEGLSVLPRFQTEPGSPGIMADENASLG